MSVRDVIAAAAGSAGTSKTYIEDVFSTYLYTGNGSTQTINNGIDLAGKGGMVWVKGRHASSHFNFDTVNGVSKYLSTNNTSALSTATTGQSLYSFNSNGFSVNEGAGWEVNANAKNYASWTFRKAPKFFDVVTYTGTGGTTDRAIPHDLGTTPGMYVVKRLNSTSDWWVWHRTQAVGTNGTLNTTAAFSSAKALQWTGNVPVNESQFCVTSGGLNNTSNISGATYVAYLFAHDTTTDGLIQCGSYTGNGSASGPTVTLGWEPQYVLIKNSTSGAEWVIVDNMRGFSETNSSILFPNLNYAEMATSFLGPTATGFKLRSSDASINTSGATYIYMAIRRGPMRTPTDGTKVFSPVLKTGDGVVTTGFTVDCSISDQRTASSSYPTIATRLTGPNILNPPWTAGETVGGGGSPNYFTWQSNDSFTTTSTFGSNNFVSWAFKRAPGFFDVVCYTGTGAARTVNHNLGVAPELMIVKSRNVAVDWMVYNASIGATKYLSLNTIAAIAVDTVWNDTSPTSTVFNLGTYSSINGSGGTYVAYLFASCPGVSKVGSYTGTGADIQINCGFTNGARFILIKRTNDIGGWLVFDTARGIVSGTGDKLLQLNGTNVEETGPFVDPYSPGFIVNTSTPWANTAGSTYIYLAIA